jgi:hypothetical protein
VSEEPVHITLVKKDVTERDTDSKDATLLLEFQVTWSVSLTLKCRAAASTETKLAYIKQPSFFNVPLDYFQKNFLE